MCTLYTLYLHKAKMCEEVRSRHQEEIRMHESQSRSVLIQSHYQRPSTLLVQPQFTLFHHFMQNCANEIFCNILMKCTLARATILHGMVEGRTLFGSTIY